MKKILIFLAGPAFCLSWVLGCRGGGPPKAQEPAPAPDSARLELPVDRLLESDPLFSRPAFRGLVQDLLERPGQGPRFWKAFLEASGNKGPLPTLQGVLKVLAHPETRPLLMEAIEQDLERASKGLAKGGRNRHYNVVVVGAGPNGAVAALNLRAAHPNLSVALVDSARLPGDVFRTFGNFCWINSPELPGFSTNAFPGLGVGVQDLLQPGTVAQGAHFVLPTLIGDLTEMAAFASGADCWLGRKAQQIQKRKTHPGYRIAMDGDRAVTADQVLLTTGLGRKPHFGLPMDPHEENLKGPSGVLLQEHFDQVAERATRLTAHNRLMPAGSRPSFLAPYAGKKVAVVGGGDSSNNLVECLLGYGNPEIYGKLPDPASQPGTKYGPGLGEPGGPREILWVNQPSRTVEEFRKNNKPRYQKTIPGDFHRIHLRIERLVDVQYDEERQHFLLYLHRDERAPLLEEWADFIWYGTGYTVTSSPLIAQLGALSPEKSTWEPKVVALINRMEMITEPFEVTRDKDTAGTFAHGGVGRKVSDGHPLAGIFLGGPVAGKLADAEEVAKVTFTKNPHSLNFNLPRVAALALHMGRLSGYSPATLSPLSGEVLGDIASPGHSERAVRVREGGAGRTVVDFPAGLPLDERAAFLEVALKLRVMRAMRGLASSADFRILLLRQHDAAHAFRLGLVGASGEKGAKVRERLGKDDAFLRLGGALLDARGSKSDLDIRVRGTGARLAPVKPRDMTLTVR